MKKNVLWVVPVCLVMLCTNDYNPFGDAANARMVVSSMSLALEDGDTAAIFSTDTLWISPAVVELIDSFSISIPGNRFWTDTCIAKPAKDDYGFAVSFYQTGKHQIFITTHRTSGTHETNALGVFVTSPLGQHDVHALAGYPCTLSTSPVQDADIIYTWSFGAKVQQQIESPSEMLITSILQRDSMPGLLWVSDARKRFHSPKVEFSIVISDSVGPSIACVNDSLLGTDTVLAGENTFLFKLEVNDPGGVGTVSMNGTVISDISKPLYVNRYNNMSDYEDSVFTVKVLAQDKHGNTREKWFWLTYDGSLPSAYTTSIVIDNITGDSATTNKPSYTIFGSLREYNESRVWVSAQVNGVSLNTAALEVNVANEVGAWNRTVSLDTGLNVVDILVKDRNDTHLARSSVSIYHDPDAVDKIKPRILQVEINEKEAIPFSNHIVRDSSFSLRALTFDESGIDSVIMHHPDIAVEQDGFYWLGRNLLAEHDDSMLVVISAKDSAGNWGTFHFYVQQNRIADIADFDLWPQQLIVTSELAIDFTVQDEDPVIPELKFGWHKPQSVVLSNLNGLNNWRLKVDPADDDTGTFSIGLKLDDGLEDTTQYWTFAILADSSDLIRIKTTKSSFPDFIELGDTLATDIQIQSGTGAEPFYFQVKELTTGSVLLDKSTNSEQRAFSWKPQSSDVGYRTLEISVRDNTGWADTLIVGLEVLPSNQNSPPAFSAGFDSALDTTGGIVNLSNPDTTFSLTYHLIDNDDPRVDKHTFAVSGPATFTFSSDSTTISATVNTAHIDTADTIKMWVVDGTGNKDSVITPLRLAAIAATDGIPPDSIDNFRAWLDPAEDVVYDAGDSSVTAWHSKHIAGISEKVTFEDRSSSSRPTLVYDAQLKQNVIEFSGTDRLADDDGVQQWEKDPFTFFVVATIMWNSEPEFKSLISPGSQPEFSLGITDAFKAGINYNDISTNTDTGIGFLPVSKDAWYVYAYASSGHSGNSIEVDVWVNGTKSIPSPQSHQSNGSGYLVLGSAHVGSNYTTFDGRMADICYYQRKLSDGEIEAVSTWLLEKYDLTPKW
ncbi:MAG: hypothetical protein GF398_14765 [Chitinivibrionales bacterium]|nr:hypothetical protein [Chitinivibrionales bacterium]